MQDVPNTGGLFTPQNFVPQNMVPMVIETSPRGERAFDIYSLLLKERIVFLGTPINDNIALALVPTRQQDRGHAGRHAQADRGDFGIDQLHGVVDGQAGADHPARAVDVKVYALIRVFPFEKQQLGDDQIGYLVVDGCAQKYDSLL